MSQVLFSEQIKLRNAMTGNDVINDKDLDRTQVPSFSSATSRTESTSDPSSTTSSSSVSISISTKSRSNSISSASGLNVASPRVSTCVASSQLIGGLSLKETLRFVIAEVESLRKAVQEVEIVKSRLNVMNSLQLEMENLSSKFQEMSHDYIGMTQQVVIIQCAQSNAVQSCSRGCLTLTNIEILTKFIVFVRWRN